MLWFRRRAQPPAEMTERLPPTQYERMAEDYLAGHGYKITERNFRLRSGEIDLIAQWDNQIVFVEVRMRADDRFGSPEETVGKDKQERIRRVAAMYLQSRDLTDRMQPRFDVIAILHKNGEKPKLTHYPSAF